MKITKPKTITFDKEEVCILMKHIVRQQVAQEAGITEDQAEKAVEALVGYFKMRLPEETNSEIYNSLIGDDNID
jgi:CRISPR/Cas system type I-B associated protein Csh2 (Cas7 group RAMP superfamily)